MNVSGEEQSIIILNEHNHDVVRHNDVILYLESLFHLCFSFLKGKIKFSRDTREGETLGKSFSQAQNFAPTLFLYLFFLVLPTQFSWMEGIITTSQVFTLPTWLSSMKAILQVGIRDAEHCEEFLHKMTLMVFG